MNKQKFTIIELLLVLSIAALMLTTALPAFTRMLKGSASTIAMRELSARLDAAKSKAIALGNIPEDGKVPGVAIVFPSHSDNSYNSAFEKRFNFQSYRVCSVKIDETGNSIRFNEWLGDWKFLPEGVVIGAHQQSSTSSPTEENFYIPESIIDASGNTNIENEKRIRNSNSELTQDTHPPIELCEIGGRSFSEGTATISIKNYILFKGNGMLRDFPNSILIKLRLGKPTSDGQSIEKVPAEGLGNYFPIVIRPTGKVVIYNELVPDT